MNYGNYTLSKEQIARLLEQYQGTDKAIILTAYAEEKERWTARVSKLLNEQLEVSKKITEIEDELRKKQLELTNFTFNVSLWDNLLSLFKIRSSKKKKLFELEKNIRHLNQELDKLLDEETKLITEYGKEFKNYPNIDRYDLALLGNSLFKPR